MKKYLCVILILAIGVITPVMAQEKGTGEFKAGYGIVTSTQTMYDIVEIFEMVFTLGSISYPNEKSIGAINLGYNYSVSDRFTLGAAFAYEQIKSDVNSGNDDIGNMKSTFYTVALESAFHYMQRDRMNLYSGLGIGYSFGNMDFESTSSDEDSFSDKANMVNFHITGIGIRFGGKFGGFAEAGFGYKGIVNAGISLQF